MSICSEATAIHFTLTLLAEAESSLPLLCTCCGLAAARSGERRGAEYTTPPQKRLLWRKDLEPKAAEKTPEEPSALLLLAQNQCIHL